MSTKHGDFTGLAADYARFRPSYPPAMADAILRYLGRDAGTVDAVDIGAGTGIWTRVLAACGLRSVIAVEPNDEMRAQGTAGSAGTDVVWVKGSAEASGLSAGSADLVTMASSFHWADFDPACREIHRILQPSGVFVALWILRLVEANPLLAEIEAHIERLKPGIQRVSSGRSAFTEKLPDLLSHRPEFTDVSYIEAKHSARQTPDQYMGVWRSVNDLRVQLGPELFQEFLDFTARRVAGLAEIEVAYLTRAWAVRRS